MLKNEIRKGIITSIYRTQFEFNKEMNTRSMTKKMLANNANIINDNNMDDNDIMRQKFANEIRDLTNINTANQDTSYKSLKARLRPIPIVAKKIYNEYADIMPHYSDNQNGRLLSVFYLTLHRLMNEADNLHRKEYIDSEKRILKIRKMTLNINKKCRKCLFMLWDIIQNFDNKNLIPKYDLVVEKHNQLLNQYDLRPRNAVYYGEEDQVDDLSDADYSPNDDNLNQRLARINKAVSFVVNKYSNKRLNADDDSEYDPADDASDNDDDESVYFDEDDYADELEDDDDDYEDEDEYRQADLEFLDEYFNDPDYKKEKKFLDNDEDEEYLPENDEDDDDDDYLLDSTSECDYEDDSSSDYDPSEDADDEDDDEQLLFDDDDYAEETEENDDDYEDDSEDAEDAQFVSDYFNDPDYDPNDDIEEEDELEYDFSFKNKKEKENIEIVLEAGIENEEDDDDSNDYDPNEEDEDEDEDEDEEVMYSCKKNNLIVVCKRFYDHKTGKVRYNWVHMNAEDYAKKYDEDYEDNEEM